MADTVSSNIANVGNQEIIWRYQTPLTSATLSRQLANVVSAGLTDKPSTAFAVGSVFTILPPFSMLYEDVGIDMSGIKRQNKLYKICVRGVETQAGMEPITVPIHDNTTVDETVAIGYVYNWGASPDIVGQFKPLSMQDIRSFEGLVICGLGFNSDTGQWVVNFDQCAEFTDSYYIRNGIATRHRLSAYPLKSAAYMPDLFALKAYNNVEDEFNLSVYVEENSTQYVVQAATTISMSTYDAHGSKTGVMGSGYHVVGWRKVFKTEAELKALTTEMVSDPSSATGQRLVTKPLAMEVYWSSLDSAAGGQMEPGHFPTAGLPAEYYPAGVIHWEGGSNRSSETYELSELFAPSVIDSKYRDKVDVEVRSAQFTTKFFNSTPTNPDMVGMTVQNTSNPDNIEGGVVVRPRIDTSVDSSMWPVDVQMYTQSTTHKVLVDINERGAYYKKSEPGVDGVFDDTVSDIDELQTKLDLVKVSTRQFKGKIPHESLLIGHAAPSSVVVTVSNKSPVPVTLLAGTYTFMYTNRQLALNVPYMLRVPADLLLLTGDSSDYIGSTSYIGWVRVPDTASVDVTPAVAQGLTVSVTDNRLSSGFDAPQHGDWFIVEDTDVTSPGGAAVAVYNSAFPRWDLAVFSQVVLDGQVKGITPTITQLVDGTYGVADLTVDVASNFSTFPTRFNDSLVGTVQEVASRIQALYDNAHHLSRAGEFKVLAVRQLAELIDRRIFPCDESVNPAYTNSTSVGRIDDGSVLCIESAYHNDAIGVEQACDAVLNLLRTAYPYVLNAGVNPQMQSEALQRMHIAVLGYRAGDPADDTQGLVNCVGTVADPDPTILFGPTNPVTGGDGFAALYDTAMGVSVMQDGFNPGFAKIQPSYETAVRMASKARDDLARADAASSWEARKDILVGVVQTVYDSLDAALRVVMWMRGFKTLWDVICWQTATDPGRGLDEQYYRVRFNGDHWERRVDVPASDIGVFFHIPKVDVPSEYSAAQTSCVGITFEAYDTPIQVTDIVIHQYDETHPLVLKTNDAGSISDVLHATDMLPLIDVLPVQASNRRVIWSYVADPPYTTAPLKIIGSGVTALLRCNDRAYSTTGLRLIGTSSMVPKITASIPVKVITEVEEVDICSVPLDDNGDRIENGPVRNALLNSNGASASDPRKVRFEARLNGMYPTMEQDLLYPTDSGVTWKLLTPDGTGPYSAGVITLVPNGLSCELIVTDQVRVFDRAVLRVQSADIANKPDGTDPTQVDHTYYDVAVLVSNGLFGQKYDFTWPTHDGQVLYGKDYTMPNETDDLVPDDQFVVDVAGTWTEAIRLVLRDDPIGGDYGADNSAGLSLARRTKWLYAALEADRLDDLSV